MPNIEVEDEFWNDYIDAVKDAEDYCDDDDWECVKVGTNWKFAWAFNGSVMIIMACNFIFLAFGSFCFWPRLIGTYFNCALGVCNMAGAIIALASAGNPFSIVCAYNMAHNTLDGDDFDQTDSGMTYQTDFVMIWIFGILQLVLACAQCTCCMLPCYMTPVKDKEHEEKKNEKKEKKEKKK